MAKNPEESKSQYSSNQVSDKKNFETEPKKEKKEIIREEERIMRRKHDILNQNRPPTARKPSPAGPPFPKTIEMKK